MPRQSAVAIHGRNPQWHRKLECYGFPGVLGEKLYVVGQGPLAPLHFVVAKETRTA